LIQPAPPPSGTGRSGAGHPDQSSSTSPLAIGLPIRTAGAQNLVSYLVAPGGKGEPLSRPVWFFLATIGGDLDCTGGRFEKPRRRVPHCPRRADIKAVCRSSAAGENMPWTGLDSRRVIGGSLVCSGGRFSGHGGPALWLKRTEVTGDMLLNDGFATTGSVVMSGATGDLGRFLYLPIWSGMSIKSSPERAKRALKRTQSEHVDYRIVCKDVYWPMSEGSRQSIPARSSLGIVIDNMSSASVDRQV
jgi:hypothetical protein